VNRFTPTRLALVVGMSLVGGCTDVAVPDGALVLCNDDDTCPDDLVCEPASRLCVRALVGDDLAPPTATITPDLVGGPFITAGSDIVVDVEFATDPLRAPTIALVQDGAELTAFVITETGSRTWQGTLAASTALPEGRLGVVVSALDGRGLPRRFPVGFVDVDITPPVVANVSFQRLPDPRKTPIAFDILDDDAIGPAIDVSLAFSVNELLSATEPPTARFDGSTLPLERNPNVENPVTFAVRWPTEPVSDGSLDGIFDVVVRVVDAAGNATEEVLVPAVEIDATPPLPPPVDEPGAVVFERAPWGRSDANGLDVYTVVGSAGSVADGEHVLVTRDPEGLREIGRTRADATGFGGVQRAFVLATGDLRDVYVTVGDVAGNMSEPIVVNETRWIASPGGKIVGDAISNPHILEELPILTAQLLQGGVTERGADAGVGALDDDILTTAGAGTFTSLASDDGDALSPTGIGLLVGSAVGHDPVRNITVIFGGSLPAIDAEGPSRGIQTGCNSGVNDVVVRRADGRFRRLSFPVTAPRPPAMANARFAFDTRRNELVLVGRPAVGRSLGAPEMWAFDGDAFTQLCTDAACATTMPDSLINMGLAFDAARQVLVAHGGDLGAATWEFNGARWTAVCGGAVTSCVAPGGSGGLVYDDGGARVLWFDGASVVAWDGLAWTPLCTDDACIATAPPPRSNTTAAWDRRRQKLVTFGGDAPGGSGCSFGSQTFPRDGVPDDAARATPPSAETWEFDGSVWNQQVTPSSPPSRSLHQMAWDEGKGTILVVGGDDCGCNEVVRDPGFRPELEENAWDYDGSDWTRADIPPTAPPGFTRTTPLAMSFHTMVPSTATGGVMALGDTTGDRFMLVKDGRYFSANGTSGGPTFLAQVAATPGGDVFALPGNGAPFAVHLVGSTFQNVCEPDPSCGFGFGVQPTFFGYGAAHDGERLVTFGGARDLNLQFGSTFSATATDETFTFSQTAGMVAPCGNGACGPTPGRRTRSRMAPTRNGGEVVLFGGMPGDGNTWIFHDGTTWEAAPSTTTPPSRQDLILVFDPTRSAVVMTGGTDDEPSTDTRGALLERVLPAFLDVVWEWSDEWHQARVVDPEQDGRPSPRFGAAAAADPDGGVTIQGGTPSPTRLFSGPPGGPKLDDVWSWDGGAERTPAQRFRVATTAAGLRPTDAVTGAVLRWFGTVDDGTAPSLLVWDGGSYVALAGTSCGDGCVEATIDQTLTRRSIVGPSRELIAVARGPRNGTAPHYAEVRTDFVEVTLTTRRN
jgi:hypothetical protein